MEHGVLLLSLVIMARVSEFSKVDVSPQVLGPYTCGHKKSILEDSNHGISHSQLLSIVHNFALYVLGVISIIIIYLSIVSSQLL